MKAIQEAGEEIAEQMAFNFGESLTESTKEIEDVDVSTKGKKVTVEYEEKEKDSSDDIVDLKQYFKQSPKRKDTANGGWHMVIPIRRYTGRQEETRESASGMSSRLYKDLLNQPAKQGYANIMSSYLHDGRGPGSAVPELNYKPKSNSITRMANRAGRGHSYVSFRTVSDKSNPASWIVNRGSADPNNKSAEVERIIKEVKNFNFK